MEAIFLTTVLTCNQLLYLRNRVMKSSFLNPLQKGALVNELQKIVPSCPLNTTLNGKQ